MSSCSLEILVGCSSVQTTDVAMSNYSSKVPANNVQRFVIQNIFLPIIMFLDSLTTFEHYNVSTYKRVHVGRLFFHLTNTSQEGNLSKTHASSTSKPNAREKLALGVKIS